MTAPLPAALRHNIARRAYSRAADHARSYAEHWERAAAVRIATFWRGVESNLRALADLVSA